MICLPPSQVPTRISLPASHLLNSIASTVRPSFMTALEKIQNLFHDVNSGALSELPLEVGFTTNYFTEKRYLWPFSLRCLFYTIAELSGVLFQWFHRWSRDGHELHFPWFLNHVFRFVVLLFYDLSGTLWTNCRSWETISALPLQLHKAICNPLGDATDRTSQCCVRQKECKIRVYWRTKGISKMLHRV